MATFDIEHDPIYRLAHAVSPLFSDAASYVSPGSSTSDEMRLFVNDPFGPDTAPVAFAFPKAVVDAYDGMDVKAQARVHRNIVKITYTRRAEILRRDCGCPGSRSPFEITFGEEIFNAVK